MRDRLVVPSLALLCSLLACTPKPNDEGDASGTSGTGDTGGTGGTVDPSATSTDPGPTTGGTGDATATGAETSGSETTGSALADCDEYCAKFEMCFMEDPGECLAECDDQFGPDDPPACAQLWADFVNCAAPLPCDEFGEAEEGACGSFIEMLEDADCFASPCTVGVGGDANMCSKETRCPDEPTRRVECDANGCTCFIDDVETMTCPEGMCTDNGVPSIDCCEGA
jgi:hypothetical protein